MPFIESFDGLKLRYTLEGTGDVALVFLHGWGGDSRTWRYQQPLASKYQIVMIDLAGHGKSGTEREHFTMESFGHDVQAVVEELNLSKIILIGWSMGGAVMLETARLLKDRIAGLIGVDTLFPQFIYSQNDPDLITQELKPFQENFVNGFTQLVNNFNTEKIDPRMVEEFLTSLPDLDQDAMLSSFKELYRWDFKQVIQEITKPIRCIVAGETLPELEMRNEYETYFPTVYMEQLKHFLVWEEPEKFNTVLEEQIQQILAEQ